MSDEPESTRPLVELFVKASAIDKERKGSCPMCHHWFMAFYVLSEQGYCDLLVTTIVPESPPRYFKDLGTSGRLPDIRIVKGVLNGVDVSNLVCDTNDEIEEFMRKFGCEDLLTWKESKDEAQAEKVTENIYKNFKSYLQTGNSTALENDLRKLNAYLIQRGHEFIIKDTLTYADCNLLPKLQHIRVAGREWRNFEIDPTLAHLWRYLNNAYQSDAFVKSCPADQDITFHYEKTIPREIQAQAKMQKRFPTLMKPTFTFEVPADVAPVNGGGGEGAAASDE